MKKLLLSIFIGLGLASTAYAVNVTVPQSFQKGSIPIGNANGTYNSGFLVAGSNITISTSTTGQISITSTGGSASAGGSNTQLQYNSSGALGGISQLTWNGTLLQNTATTTLATTTISQLTLGNGLISTFLAADPTGKLIATTSPISSVSLTAGGTITGSSFTFASGSPDTTWNIICASSTCTFNHPNNLQTTITNPVTGTGTIGFGPNWTSASAIGTGKLIDNGTVLGMNATSTTIGFDIQGTAGTNDIFNVASSSTTSLFKITAAGNVQVATLTASSLLLADANKNLGSYGGASNCSSGTAVIGLSIAGATTCSLNGLQAALTNPDTGTGTNGQAAYFTGSTALASANSLLNNGTVVGVNASSSTVSLNVQGTTTLNPFNVASSSTTSLLIVLANGNVGIGSATPTSNLVVQTAASQSTAALTVASSTGATLFSITPCTSCSVTYNLIQAGTTTAGSLFVVDSLGKEFINGMVFASSTVPAIATSTGAGSAGTASITGGNAWGEVTVNALTSPAVSSVIVTVTPNVSAPTKLICTFTPSNPNAEALTNTTQIAATSTASTWGIVSNSSGLTTGTTYKWFYNCGGY